MMPATCTIAASLSSHLRDQDRADAADAAVDAVFAEILADLLDSCHIVTRFGQRNVHELVLDDEMQDDCYADECTDLRAWAVEKLTPAARARAQDEAERRRFSGDL